MSASSVAEEATRGEQRHRRLSLDRIIHASHAINHNNHAPVAVSVPPAGPLLLPAHTTSITQHIRSRHAIPPTIDMPSPIPSRLLHSFRCALPFQSHARCDNNAQLWRCLLISLPRLPLYILYPSTPGRFKHAASGKPSLPLSLPPRKGSCFPQSHLISSRLVASPHLSCAPLPQRLMTTLTALSANVSPSCDAAAWH